MHDPEAERGCSPYTDWRFNAKDFERYSTSYWQFPVRLVHPGETALVRHVWKAEPANTQGGGSVISLLPVLALHTWPTKEVSNAIRDADLPGAKQGWTPWATLTQRRQARLSGLDAKTVQSATQFLVNRGLLETEQRRRARGGGGRQTYYRLRNDLYPLAANDKYVEVHGWLLYGGLWSVMPASARNLYLTLRAITKVRNADALVARILESGGSGEGTAWDTAYRMASASHSIRELIELTGMSRSAVMRARDLLERPHSAVCSWPFLRVDKPGDGSALQYEVAGIPGLNDPHPMHLDFDGLNAPEMVEYWRKKWPCRKKFEWLDTMRRAA
jgi:hypothetical protein